MDAMGMFFQLKTPQIALSKKNMLPRGVTRDPRPPKKTA